MNNQRRRTLFPALLAALLLSVGLAPTASASASEVSSVTAPTPPGVTYIPECLAQVAIHAGLDRELCRVETGIAVGAATRVSSDQASLVTGLTTAQKSSLVLAAAAGTVRSKTYNQWVTGASYTRTQKGKWYFDGSRAWVTQAYCGYTGSQACVTSWAVGLTLNGSACSDSGISSNRRLYSAWDVSVGAITYGWDMAMNVHADGSASGTNVTTS